MLTFLCSLNSGQRRPVPLKTPSCSAKLLEFACAAAGLKPQARSSLTETRPPGVSANFCNQALAVIVRRLGRVRFDRTLVTQVTAGLTVCDLSASDDPGGSGVKQVQFALGGAQNTGRQRLEAVLP